MDGYFTITEAAAELGVSRQTIARWIKNGSLTAYRSGANRREKYVRVTDIDALKRMKPVQRTNQESAQ